jgi:hypothetical protein
MKLISSTHLSMPSSIMDRLTLDLSESGSILSDMAVFAAIHVLQMFGVLPLSPLVAQNHFPLALHPEAFKAMTRDSQSLFQIGLIVVF